MIVLMLRGLYSSHHFLGGFNRSSCRRVFAERYVCAAIVVMAQIFFEHAAQVSLIEHDDVVATLATN